MGQGLPCLKLGGNVGWVGFRRNMKDLFIGEDPVHCMSSISDKGACASVPVEDPIQTDFCVAQ